MKTKWAVSVRPGSLILMIYGEEKEQKAEVRLQVKEVDDLMDCLRSAARDADKTDRRERD